MKILIDNGHGENTPGKRSPDGELREYSYTREIADRVVLELTKRGYDAERIVKENVDVPLVERARRVNEVCGRLGSSKVILVSIHCNAAGNGGWLKARGWSAYTSIGRTKADKLADRLYESARMYFTGQRIREDRSDGDPDWEEGFYILRKTKCPAVLTENFFQDNQEDVAYLLSSEGKQAIVDVHVEGIINYIKDNE
nr:MAG TPA: Cell wall hydrolase autolysin [Caudoviricetes sp.]